MLSTTEAADMLGITPARVRQLAGAGRFGPVDYTPLGLMIPYIGLAFYLRQIAGIQMEVALTDAVHVVKV